MQKVEFSGQFTRTFLTVDAESEMKELHVEDGGPATDEEAAVAASTSQDPGDYPSGVKLAFIVAALVLSVFLFSLDQVSLPFEVLPIDNAAC